MSSSFSKIISIENITQAYFDILSNFDSKNKSLKYFGFDGKNLNDFNLSSQILISNVRKELINFSEIDPALKLRVPKKNKPDKRTVFVHNIKERVKAQAIYRILEPIFDKYLSDFLFSYRKSHPQYLAIKTVTKRYRKFWSEDYILLGDISNYSDNIDRNILRQQIKKLGLGLEIERLLDLYLENYYLETGVRTRPEKGIITGLPVTVLFNNLYLDSIDKYLGQKLSVYRRVGDDFIIQDKDQEKINQAQKFLQTELENLNLKKDQQKILILKSDQRFIFMGHKFDRAKISIGPSAVRRFKLRLSRRLRFIPGSISEKQDKLKSILFKNNSVYRDFVEIIRSYNQINDINQIKLLSEYFFIRLAIFFYNKSSHRTLRLVKKMSITKSFPSLFSLFIKVYTGEKKIAEIKDITVI